MAAGWMPALGGEKVDVYSGGSEPAAEINAAAVAAMARSAIDISGQLPQPWADEVVRAADVIVTRAAAMPARSTRQAIPSTGS